MQITLPVLTLVAASAAVTGLSTSDRSESSLDARTFSFGHSFSHSNWYGASNKPWQSTGGWGWFLGKKCDGLPKWQAPTITKPHFCKFFWNNWNPACQAPVTPKPPTTPGLPCKDGYATKFKDYTTVAPEHSPYAGQVVGAATIDNENYLTYGLVDNLEQCFTVCNDIKECAFVNFYEDRDSDVKNDIGASGKYTCAAYKACSGTEKLSNFGAQDQGEGSELTKIFNSSGYCKSGSC